MRIAPVVAFVLTMMAAAPAARAQGVDRRYAEEPTDGVALPTTPIAGEHDARAVAVNAGGLALLRGAELTLALDLEDPNVATSAGPGVGVFVGAPLGGGALPRMGVGLGLEWLRPPRAQLEPDPGQSFRATLAYALALGRHAGLGLAWHRYSADGPLAGVTTVDAGLSTRWGNGFALGATARDLATGPIAGAPVQRRYELEAALRPGGTEGLELALGGRVGETRGDLDGWARGSLRLGRGAWLHAALESRALHVLASNAAGVAELDARDYRATVGLELSFGHLGVTALATGLRDDVATTHALGGELLVRASAVGPEALGGEPAHIERVELAGTIDARALTALVVRLRAIARDPSAVGVVLTFDSPSAGWATFEELREEVRHLRAAKKKVFAYLVSGTSRDYLVASAADRVYLDPAGGLRLIGLSGTSLYFKGLFDHLGVLPQFEKIGEYKSAPEEFTERGPTPAAAAMHAELYGAVWTGWLDAVSAGRHLTTDQVKAIVDAGPYSAGALATDPRLVDFVGTPEQIAARVTAELGGAYPVAAARSARPGRWQEPRIAVIYVDGDIVDGKSQSLSITGQRTVGGEDVIAALTAARADPEIGAIVLRIDSPGGSALASELIAREVFATRGVKPIVCSMSDYAASGGYFVAAGCDAIYAEPMTITGSIGIFSGKFDLSGLLAKLGVTTDTYRQGRRADAESMLRPYTDDERAALLGQLRYAYGRFVGAVAEGRKLTRDAVDDIGRGHVWTGGQAKPIHLVDELGGLGAALAEAQRRMGLPASAHVALTELPGPPSSPFGLAGKLLGLHADASAAAPWLAIPAVRAALGALPASVLLGPDRPQARLPFEIRWD